MIIPDWCWIRYNVLIILPLLLIVSWPLAYLTHCCCKCNATPQCRGSPTEGPGAVRRGATAALGPGAARRGARGASTVRATAAAVVGFGREGGGEVILDKLFNSKRKRKWEKTQQIFFIFYQTTKIIPRSMDILVAASRENKGNIFRSGKGVCFSEHNPDSKALFQKVNISCLMYNSKQIPYSIGYLTYSLQYLQYKMTYVFNRVSKRVVYSHYIAPAIAPFAANAMHLLSVEGGRHTGG